VVWRDWREETDLRLNVP